MINWKQDPMHNGRNSDGVTFATTNTNTSTSDADQDGNGVILATTNPVDCTVRRGNRSNITCFRCGMNGHYANECPTRTEARPIGKNELLTTGVTTEAENQTNEQSEFAFCQENANKMTMTHAVMQTHIPVEWNLLDSQSTINMFSNKNLLKNIRISKESLNIQ
jgi:Zinc knuckle